MVAEEKYYRNNFSYTAIPVDPTGVAPVFLVW